MRGHNKHKHNFFFVGRYKSNHKIHTMPQKPMMHVDLTWTHVLILLMLALQLALLIAVIMMLRRSATTVQDAVRTQHQRLMASLLPFGGPYEACEDQICPNFEDKKNCMISKEDQIRQCCQESCKSKCAHLPPEALQECMSACTPTFR